MKKRKVGIFLCLCALFCLLCAAEETFPERLYDGKSFVEYAGTSDVPEVNGYSAYVYNVETGSVMYQKKSERRCLSGVYRQAYDCDCSI